MIGELSRATKAMQVLSDVYKQMTCSLVEEPCLKCEMKDALIVIQDVIFELEKSGGK